jgi:hypothetical protein
MMLIQMSLDMTPLACQASVTLYAALVLGLDLSLLTAEVIATENIITADQIWRCDGRLMKSTEGAQLKDI